MCSWNSRKKEKNDIQATGEKIMAGKIANLMKDMNPPIQEAL